jgi:hypothetical protein
MATTTQLAATGLTATGLTATGLNISDARCEALFASALQRSDEPTAAMVSAAITGAVRQFGIGGCAAQMAQEFGDHPGAAASRMRWVRLVSGSASIPG